MDQATRHGYEGWTPVGCQASPQVSAAAACAHVLLANYKGGSPATTLLKAITMNHCFNLQALLPTASVIITFWQQRNLLSSLVLGPPLLPSARYSRLDPAFFLKGKSGDKFLRTINDHCLMIMISNRYWSQWHILIKNHYQRPSASMMITTLQSVYVAVGH